MAHLAAKDIYYEVGKKIDGLHVRSPWNDDLYALIKSLFSVEEADVFIKIPYLFSDIEQILRVTKINKNKLIRILEQLCTKGLVVDIYKNGKYYYMPSPMVVGIFEFTMMRTGKNLNSKEWGKLFSNYLGNSDVLYSSNMGNNSQVSVARALPHGEALSEQSQTMILDYESAVEISKSAQKCAVGLCSCRHEKFHAEEKKCDIPMDTCATFGWAADYLIRRNMAKEVSAEEMIDNLNRSKELGLMLTADNVKQNVTFICQCCSCCCNLMLGINVHGFPDTIISSNFIANLDIESCNGCGKCAKACPIHAIDMIPTKNKGQKKKAGKNPAIPRIDTSICLGCGVCSLKCKTESIKLVDRGKRVIHPETTFERVLLQCIENGNLANQIFDNPLSLTQKYMRGFLGGFFRLSPVKKALMSDLLRSRFLGVAKGVVKLKGKGWLAEEL